VSYEELKSYMDKFRKGEMTKLEMGFAVALWQRGGARR
jgi:hypothetical protein